MVKNKKIKQKTNSVIHYPSHYQSHFPDLYIYMLIRIVLRYNLRYHFRISFRICWYVEILVLESLSTQSLKKKKKQHACSY